MSRIEHNLSVKDEIVDSQTFDPAPNFLGGHPKVTAAGCATLGTLLAVNLMRSQWSFSNLLRVPVLLKVSTALGFFSSAHAFAFDYKPKTSRFPFGHTSSKEVIAGSAMFGSGLLFARELLFASQPQVNISRSAAAYFWVKRAVALFSSATLMYLGIKLIADGFGLCTSIEPGQLPSIAEQDELLDQPSCLKVQANSFLETLGNTTHRVWHIPGLLNADAIADPSLKTVDTSQIFKKGTVALAFGKPNVFLMAVKAGVTQRIDAKSLWRDTTRIATSDDKGKVQSGVFLVPRNLNSETIEELEKAAQEAVGTSASTCAKTNMLILSKAGFSFGDGRPIDGSIFPHILLKNILSDGLICNGKKVEFDIVCTTEDSNLEKFYAALTSAVLRTPCRHVERSAAENDVKGKEQRAREAQKIHEANERALRLAQGQSPAAGRFKVFASKPSSELGSFARAVWGPHVVYRVKFKEAVDIDGFLPRSLHAFPQTKPSSFTLLKRDWLFCPVLLRRISNNMASSFRFIDYFSETRLLELLKDGAKRNFILTKDELVLMRLGEPNSTVDWALSKHVLAASAVGNTCPKDGRGFPMVRFAGELWYDHENNTLHINDNSGTFMPKPDDLSNAVRFAERMLPGVKIVAEVGNEMCSRP